MAVASDAVRRKEVVGGPPAEQEMPRPPVYIQFPSDVPHWLSITSALSDLLDTVSRDQSPWLLVKQLNYVHHLAHDPSAQIIGGQQHKKQKTKHPHVIPGRFCFHKYYGLKLASGPQACKNFSHWKQQYFFC